MAGPSGKYPRRPSRLTAGAFPGEPGGQRRLAGSAPGALPLPAGTERRHARGRRPRAKPGLSGDGWGSFCPALRPFGRRLPKSPESAKKLPARPKIQLRRPQPATCQCAPYPGLVSGAQDPGERPHPSPTPQPCSPGTRLSSLPPAPPHLRHRVISCRRPLAKAPHTPPQPDPQRLGPPPRRDPHLPPGQAAESRAAGGAAGELTRSPEPCPGRLPALARSFRPRAAAAGAATEASSARPPASAPPLGSSPEAGPELAGRGWARSRLDLDGTRAAGKGLLSPSTTTFEQLEIEGR
ncbi:unnamed protein product [Rangifer tarandus platyrhynchus]|uniref:Basic proline-rich protein-like n=1 Tax=Rangifer tarandus platyrhynchus TaxID=3082113 RepID=A0ABN8XZ97_RANTA|nr:unnamed protein product [Rangifer tarandus platyrhynchus]